MTHKDIYEKFMIEYDKANITSSYPSLTKYEIATILDKAYLALIAQKLTGNNQRKVPFEGDIKAIHDLQPLIRTKKYISVTDGFYKHADNDLVFNTPSNMMYYIQSQLLRNTKSLSSIDKLDHTLLTTQLIDHNSALRYMATDSNLPWIERPVCYILNDIIHVLADAYKIRNDDSVLLNVTYIKKPALFTNPNVDDDDDIDYFTLNRSELNGSHIIG